MSASLRSTATNLVVLRATRARIVVVGSSGWLGRAALAMLDGAFPAEELEQRVLLFGSCARQVQLPSGRNLACRALADLPETDVADGLILHFGYLTKDKTALMSVDDYVRPNEAILDRLVGAVYKTDGPGQPTHDKPGKEANLYGWMKAKHEAEFA